MGIVRCGKEDMNVRCGIITAHTADFVFVAIRLRLVHDETRSPGTIVRVVPLPICLSAKFHNFILCRHTPPQLNEREFSQVPFVPRQSEIDIFVAGGGSRDRKEMEVTRLLLTLMVLFARLWTVPASVVIVMSKPVYSPGGR